MNFGTLRTFINRSDDFLFLCAPRKSWMAQAVDVSVASERKEVRSIGRRAVGGATRTASATRWHHWPLWKSSSSQGAKSLEPSSHSSTERPIISPGDSGLETWGQSVRGDTTALLSDTRICPQLRPEDSTSAKSLVAAPSHLLLPCQLPSRKSPGKRTQGRIKFSQPWHNKKKTQTLFLCLISKL